MRNILILTIIFVNFIAIPSKSQILIEDPERGISAPVARAEETKVGRSAATDYFKKRQASRASDDGESSGRRPDAEISDRVMMLHVGTFVNDTAYRWGRDNKIESPGEAQLGVTYRVGEWKSSMDLYFRAELMSYDIANERPLKLSVMPIIAFPDVRSDFPLYFGAGAGVGIFFKQIGDESDLSFDYAIIVGARFPELFDFGGLFFETGLKGQVNLLSNGQHDGVFIAGGAIFNF
jgi:hypothetical protein